MQTLLVDWLERYNALLEPTEAESAMRDEIDLALAAILAASVTSPSANLLRVVCSAKSARLTAARVCLIQSMYVHGEGSQLRAHNFSSISAKSPRSEVAQPLSDRHHKRSLNVISF